MNERPEPSPLLDDVMSEALPPDFRAAMLGETLRLARRRRRWQQARPVAGVLGMLFLAAWLAWHNGPATTSKVPPIVPVPARKAYQVVETRPLSAAALVATRKFACVTVISSQAALAQTATSSAAYRLINDAQLLALVGPRQAVLIRTGPNSEELVFARVADSSQGRPAN